jgi:hypothetical protein
MGSSRRAAAVSRDAHVTQHPPSRPPHRRRHAHPNVAGSLPTTCGRHLPPHTSLSKKITGAVTRTYPKPPSRDPPDSGARGSVGSHHLIPTPIQASRDLSTDSMVDSLVDSLSQQSVTGSVIQRRKSKTGKADQGTGRDKREAQHTQRKQTRGRFNFHCLLPMPRSAQLALVPRS